jgi:hypothetical protein
MANREISVSKGIKLMERVIELVVEYSGIVAPGLSLWAALLLHIQPRHSNNSMVQVLYFLALSLVSTLTVRATVNNDPSWLISATSLGALIVAGALKRPVEDFDDLLVTAENS